MPSIAAGSLTGKMAVGLGKRNRPLWAGKFWRTRTGRLCLELRSLPADPAECRQGAGTCLAFPAGELCPAAAGRMQARSDLASPRTKVAMIKEEIIMNEQIKKAIRQRARAARNNNELVRAVFDTFKISRIDVRQVSLEDMKIAVVEAARAARASQDEARQLPA